MAGGGGRPMADAHEERALLDLFNAPGLRLSSPSRASSAPCARAPCTFRPPYRDRELSKLATERPVASRMPAPARSQGSSRPAGIARLIGVSCGADSKWCRGDAQAPQLVDFCIVNPVREKDPRVDAQHRRLLQLFATESASLAHWTFRCDSVACTEGWDALSAKTHALLKSALAWTPRWRSLLKLDTDGFMCLNSARLIRLRAHLEVVYAGLLTYPPGTPGENPWQRNTSKYRFPAQSNIEWRVKHNRLATAPYMQGAAYLVGRKVVQFAVRQSFSDLINLQSWEDASVGLWTNSMATRAITPLRQDVTKGSAGCACNEAADVHHRCTLQDFERVCSKACTVSEI